MVKIYDLSEEGVTSDFLAGCVEQEGYVFFESVRSSQRKMVKDVKNRLNNETILYFEVNSLNWPMCVYDYSVMDKSSIEYLKKEVVKAEEVYLE